MSGEIRDNIIDQLEEENAKLKEDRIEWHDRYSALYAWVETDNTQPAKFSLWYNEEFKP